MSTTFYADPCSLSNPNYYIITNASFDWNVDFETKRIHGFVDLNFKRNNESSTGDNQIILDTRDLTVHSVQDLSDNSSLSFSFGDVHKVYGKSLKIKIKNGDAKNVNLRIKYETSPQSSALQWLEPEQTLGRKLPYLFSQCQAIHARSLYPCQDTPTVKFAYKAKVSVKKSFVALMSAIRKENPTKLDGDLLQYEFDQPVPIPSYLLAIVVGDLVSKKIGPRSHVWTEKEYIEAAAYEFAETEQMIKSGETLLSEYVWGVYDLLVLPPTFPYGGMENPCLTFVTPTLLAGDRSLADVVIHEISHSWTGNLITNRNWEHFWLNEGFTMFVERKIIGLMNTEKHRQFDCLEGWRKLHEAVQLFGDTHEFTKLVPNLTNQDPDDAFSAIPYEKGHMLLYHLEEKLGGVEIFNKYLKAHVEHFKWKSFDTNDWKAFLYDYFKDKKDILDSVDWEGWLYKPGMPPVELKFDKILADQCTQLCEKLLSSEITSIDSTIKGFSGHQLQELLSQILDQDPLTPAKMDELNKHYDSYFSKTKNSEILFRWLRIGIKAEWEPIIQPALNFVTIQGRMKYTRPIYRDLLKWSKSKQVAIDTFLKNRKYMHQTTASLVAKDLGL